MHGEKERHFHARAALLIEEVCSLCSCILSYCSPVLYYLTSTVNLCIFLQEAILNLLIWFQVVPKLKLYVSHWARVPNQSTSLLNMEVVLESSFLLALLCFLTDAKSLGGLQTEAASCLISAQRADDVCMTCCGWPSPVSRLSRCVWV